MKKIKTEEAVGAVLFHDITQIIPGKTKGRAFKKGHVITKEDIPLLLSLGKDNIYVWEETPGMVHENDAAVRLKDLTAGEGLAFGELKEGKIEFIAEKDGLLKIDEEALFKLNYLGEIVLSTLYNNTVVKKGQTVAATRIIPLMIEEEKLFKAEEIAKEKIVRVIDIKPRKVGIVTTGNEVFYGRIKDGFGPVITSKVGEYGCEVSGQVFMPDDAEKITEAVKYWIQKGVELIICTGGMSVDPDDVTPTAIKNTGAELVSYGSPVLPGSMFLLAYHGNIPVIGLPGGALFSKRTAFDLILPRILAGERLTRADIATYGHGGFLI